MRANRRSATREIPWILLNPKEKCVRVWIHLAPNRVLRLAFANTAMNSREFLDHVSNNELRKKSTIFWDIMSCSPLKVNRHFGGTYRLRLQGTKISRESSRNILCYNIRPALGPSNLLSNGYRGLFPRR
jgi:hypothetical protein